MPSSRSLARTWPYPRHRHFEANMRATAKGWFETKGCEVSKRKPYLLSKRENWKENIILPEVASFIDDAAESQSKLRRNFPLHKYIHHGLSSQAMLFNLLGPMIVKEDLNPLKEVIQNNGIAWPGEGSTARFEYEDRSIFNEDSGQPTSIDMVVIDNRDQPKIFIEAKFVEQEFGGCSVFEAGDCDGRNPTGNLALCYLDHIGRKYWSLMKHHKIDLGVIGKDSTCIFANYYQFFRELIFALEHDGVFILLCDERNPVFYVTGESGNRGLIPFLTELLPEEASGHVSIITIQELVEQIKQTGTHDDWIVEFEKKYGLID